MTFDGLTPKQRNLIRILLTEEAQTNRLGEQFRAKSILKKMGEQDATPTDK